MIIYYVIFQVDIADFLQCDLITFDYSGFGLSTGTPTEKNLYQNMDTVYQFSLFPHKLVFTKKAVGIPALCLDSVKK